MMFLLLGCAAFADLPEGWENATRVEEFSQAECKDEGAFALTAEADGDEVAVALDHVGARCAQDLEAWWQPTGESGADVLVQPVDMVAASVAKCDCAYDLDLVLPVAAPVTLGVYKRGDRHADDDPQPSLLGTVTAE